MSIEAMTLDGILTSSISGRVAIVTGAGQSGENRDPGSV
jgi:hypothetical protein